jgi:hypothetical protein
MDTTTLEAQYQKLLGDGRCYLYTKQLRLILGSARVLLVGMIDAFEDVDVPHRLLQPVVVHAPLFDLRRTMPDTAPPKPMWLPVAAPVHPTPFGLRRTLAFALPRRRRGQKRWWRGMRCIQSLCGKQIAYFTVAHSFHSEI